MNIHNPPNLKPADYLYAILSVDENGNEGIFSMVVSGVAYPLVLMNEDLLDSVFNSRPPSLEQEFGKKLIKAKFKRIS